MGKTNDNPVVIRAVDDGPLFRDTFVEMNVKLEEIQKSLEEYLETKRMAFPR